MHLACSEVEVLRQECRMQERKKVLVANDQIREILDKIR